MDLKTGGPPIRRSLCADSSSTATGGVDDLAVLTRNERHLVPLAIPAVSLFDSSPDEPETTMKPFEAYSRTGALI